jgi:hypothetical protein
MTIAAAIFGCFAVLVGATFLFALIVYLKEYGREAQIVKQYEKTRDQDFQLQQQLLTSGNPIYLNVPAKKKKAKAPSETIQAPKVSDKDKKNLN